MKKVSCCENKAGVRPLLCHTKPGNPSIRPFLLSSLFLQQRVQAGEQSAGSSQSLPRTESLHLAAIIDLVVIRGKVKLIYPDMQFLGTQFSRQNVPLSGACFSAGSSTKRALIPMQRFLSWVQNLLRENRLNTFSSSPPGTSM